MWMKKERAMLVINGLTFYPMVFTTKLKLAFDN
jgi:hypothetical protein